MNAIRDSLKKVQNEIAELAVKQDTLRSLEYELNVKRHEIIKQLLIEEKPFKGTTWELRINSYDKLYLVYIGSRQNDNLDEVEKLCATSWHCDFKLEDGVILQFDDNQLSLAFDDSSKIAEIANRHDLVIQSSNVSERAATLRKELSALETVCFQLELKINDK